MPFTGEIVHGWRIAKITNGRRPMHGTGVAVWVDEPTVELVKGHNMIRARGQQGIDPEIVLAFAVTSALKEDIRQANDDGDFDVAFNLEQTLATHERWRDIKVNGNAVQRVLNRKGKAAVFQVEPAGAGAKGRT